MNKLYLKNNDVILNSFWLIKIHQIVFYNFSNLIYNVLAN